MSSKGETHHRLWRLATTRENIYFISHLSVILRLSICHLDGSHSTQLSTLFIMIEIEPIKLDRWLINNSTSNMTLYDIIWLLEQFQLCVWRWYVSVRQDLP